MFWTKHKTPRNFLRQCKTFVLSFSLLNKSLFSILISRSKMNAFQVVKYCVMIELEKFVLYQQAEKSVASQWILRKISRKWEGDFAEVIFSNSRIMFLYLVLDVMLTVFFMNCLVCKSTLSLYKCRNCSSIIVWSDRYVT